jgi:hypothetical protein
MPFQNRVFPDQSLRAISMRGAWLGNRGGKFHRANQTVGAKQFANTQWIYCVLEFKNRTREVFGKGYTELFFACEASALASGHRPCFECQREKAKQFQRLFQQVHGLEKPPKVAYMDEMLHEERMRLQLKCQNLNALPNGVMIKQNEKFYLKTQDAWHEWLYDTHLKTKSVALESGVVCTPPTIISILESGFKPQSPRHQPPPLRPS